MRHVARDLGGELWVGPLAGGADARLPNGPPPADRSEVEVLTHRQVEHLGERQRRGGRLCRRLTIDRWDADRQAACGRSGRRRACGERGRRRQQHRPQERNCRLVHVDALEDLRGGALSIDRTPVRFTTFVGLHNPRMTPSLTSSK